MVRNIKQIKLFKYSKNTNTSNNLHITGGPVLSSCAVIWSKFLNLTWIRASHQHHCTYSTCPSNKIFVRLLFAFKSCYVIRIEWTFYYFVMCQCMSITIRVNGTVQFTFFLVMKLNITIATSCDYLNLLTTDFPII